MKLTTKLLKQLIKEEMDMDFKDTHNVDDDIMVALTVLAGHRALAPESRVARILDLLQKRGFLKEDPRMSGSAINEE